MSSVITLAADSTTLVLNGHIFNDFGVGDYLELTPVNALTSRTNSRNGGLNIQKRSDGGVHTLTVRVQRFSDDDIYLNSARNQSLPVIFDGSAKETGIKDGDDFVESFILESGSITTQPTFTKNDQDGNALAEYVLEFRDATRNL